MKYHPTAKMAYKAITGVFEGVPNLTLPTNVVCPILFLPGGGTDYMEFT